MAVIGTLIRFPRRRVIVELAGRWGVWGRCAVGRRVPAAALLSICASLPCAHGPAITVSISLPRGVLRVANACWYPSACDGKFEGGRGKRDAALLKDAGETVVPGATWRRACRYTGPNQ